MVVSSIRVFKSEASYLVDTLEITHANALSIGTQSSENSSAVQETRPALYYKCRPFVCRIFNARLFPFYAPLGHLILSCRERDLNLFGWLRKKTLEPVQRSSESLSPQSRNLSRL
ncbi:hypothetical protein CDAR_183271 [Caerostris darwini]|uniref:Uncharacterized protein n=1 Tax=Caerostris darwini TaxID=1538125 RepID=A0AAV4WMJ0_9ARAC|nr:hypothetical protein CDAR_183271 [Caerostris darwini]